MEVASLHQLKNWSTGKFNAIAAVIPAKAGIQKIRTGWAGCPRT
jgi:hypothetical protein